MKFKTSLFAFAMLGKAALVSAAGKVFAGKSIRARHLTRACGMVLVLISFAFFNYARYINGQTVDTTAARQNVYVGNDACAACHSSIYQSYARHPMALDSGPIADQSLLKASFRHAPSSIAYRIYQQEGKTFFSYERSHDPATRGKQELHYFVGSGKRGRSYLFSVDGYLYQAPVSFYAQKNRWDISPGYESERSLPTRPIEESCLFCHASQVQHIQGTQNRYASPPFAHNGVSCERCHGPGGAHVEGKVTMVNPARLTPERRDSICAQCHLMGEARIARPGRDITMFRPGELLSDYVSYFVRDTKGQTGLKAVSHVEALAQSACKLRSGDAMSCLSCHQPHSVPSAEERVSYYRQKCLACHTEQGATLSQKQHYAQQQDCISCHMPATASSDIGHTALSDHRILRKPLPQVIEAKPADSLIQFGARNSDDLRGLGLAYAELALQTLDPLHRAEAFRRLTQILPAYPKDVEVLTKLAYLHQGRGEARQAAAYYEAALREDPQHMAAAVNLGVLYAEMKRAAEAISLWRAVIARNPGSSGAGMNLALLLCTTNQRGEARQVLRTLLRYNPDHHQSKQLLRNLNSAQGRCSLEL